MKRLLFLLLAIVPILSQAQGPRSLFWALNRSQFAATDTDFVKPLDFAPGAAIAYGLRQLATSYTGPLIRVRRSSDNATLDLNPTPAGNFDAAAFSAFVGADVGYVAIWYDQSGNGNNATAASANQMELRLNVHRGRPALYTPGGRYYDFTTSALGGQNADVFLVARSDSWGSSGSIYFGQAATNFWGRPFNGNGIYIQGGSLDGSGQGGMVVTGTMEYLNLYTSGTNSKTAVKGTATYLLTQAPATIATGAQSFRIGSWPSTTGWDLFGYMSSFIVYPGERSSTVRANLKSNINSYYNLF